MANLEDESPVLITDLMIESSLNISGDTAEEDYKEYVKSNASTLRLEYAKILKIDNLNKLTSLRKLYLDNNYIEEISGLESLIHLQWLDLSFNRLTEINGLDKLIHLEVLSLNNNEIREIKGLDSQNKLQILRISSNKLDTLNNILYLRKFSTLRTLSIRNNSFCSEKDDWKSFTIALLPQITFLESTAISTNTRKEAVATHQGIILRTEGKEDKIATEKSKIDAEAKEFKKDSKAFVSGFRNNGLRKSITEGENEKDIFGVLITNRNYISLKAKFESDEDDIGHRIYKYGHEQHELRDGELKDLEVCLELGEKEYRQKGIIAVDEFLNEKNRIQTEYLNLLNETTQGGGGGSEEEERSFRKEFDRMKEICQRDLNIFRDKIMNLEFCLVNQTDKTIAFFEKILLKSLDTFLNEVHILFSEARNADIRFYRRIVELIESETAVEECKFWREKAGHCHDIRQTRLSSIEVELEAIVRHFYRVYVEDLYENLQSRNRSRILELQHFVDKCRAETEEYDFSPSNAVEEDEVY